MKRETTSILEPAVEASDELERARRLGELAATVGFDWGSAEEAMEKVVEEVEELQEALETRDEEEITGELGDLLFAVINVARKTGIDPSEALGRTNAKFEQRFGAIEAHVATNRRDWDDVPLDEMEEVWQSAKGPKKT